MNRPLIAREGWGIILFFSLLTALSALVHWFPAAVAGVLLALSLWFFRDPERGVPAGERLVVAPADGRVMFVREVEEDRYLGGKAVMVSIFLSILDVHINRVPVGGTIGYRDYMPGKFLSAWNETVGDVNERSYLGIDTGSHRVLVSQVAGMLARRIITWPVVGQAVRVGERFGLIRFGSCTQVWLPPGSEVLVRAGDRVRGGATLIGRLPE